MKCRIHLKANTPDQTRPASSGAVGSEWSDWGILVSFPDRPLRRISETVKARTKDEAERKAARFLLGRGTLLFEVLNPNTPRHPERGAR
jgi:hypothetical protein